MGGQVESDREDTWNQPTPYHLNKASKAASEKIAP